MAGSKLSYWGFTGKMQVPIYIPLGMGREETLDSIVTDVRKLAAILEEEDLPSVLGI